MEVSSNYLKNVHSIEVLKSYIKCRNTSNKRPPTLKVKNLINAPFLEGALNRVKYLFAHAHVNDVIGHIRE